MKSIRIHRTSKLFQPVLTSQVKVGSSTKNTSNSQKLMLAAGVINQAYNGLVHLLPLGHRALKKLTSLVENSIENNLDAQRISIPSLTSSDLWKKTGRLEQAGAELFKLVDRHKKEFILAPTHEESVANLIATVPLLSHRNLPLLLYQITNKYRDEMRPRFGLIRSKEFLMKDLYSFDNNEESAKNTYKKVCDVYEDIFTSFGVKFIKVGGDTGLMGGVLSHEYHFPADIGDDTLVVCGGCQTNWNKVIYDNENTVCSQCGSSSLSEHKGIEVGHTFLLGTKYSSALQAQFVNESQQRLDLVMGSYGMGLTRILGAAVEVLSTDNEIRWPKSIAPYSVVIIPPKKGSNESVAADVAFDFYEALQSIEALKDDCILDDRDNMTIGRRLKDACLVGYPKIIVVGKSAMTPSPTYELHDPYQGTTVELSFQGILDALKDEQYCKTDSKIYVRTCA